MIVMMEKVNDTTYTIYPGENKKGVRIQKILYGNTDITNDVIFQNPRTIILRFIPSEIVKADIIYLE